MKPEDVILVSVDDHIAEPATMFDAHVPAKYKQHAPRVETDERGIQQWWYGDLKGRNLGLNAVEPVYREIPGFQEDVSGCRTLESLPAAARDYVTFVEEQVGVPIELVSVGPSREQVVQRGNGS